LVTAPPRGSRGLARGCASQVVLAAIVVVLGWAGFRPGAAAAADLVAFDPLVAVGTIVVHTQERRLYWVATPGQALRYPVGVGRIGRQWAGASVIDGKYIQPNWAPPAAIRRDRPHLPDVIPGGSPANPMGAAALTLSGGDYAIHGTNAPKSIGTVVSYGCIRMHNADILDLYSRVHLGTAVLVQP
jgi:lipoprotein-anchoring transpeptidase ErfK/SrfK